MKKIILVLSILYLFTCIISCNNSKSIKESKSNNDSIAKPTNPVITTSEFPFLKAKQAALNSSDAGGKVLGYYKESDSKAIIYILGRDGRRWSREFVLLTNESHENTWLMLIAPFGSLDTKFEIIK